MSSSIINFESDICPNSDIEKENEENNFISQINKSQDTNDEKETKIHLKTDNKYS